MRSNRLARALVVSLSVCAALALAAAPAWASSTCPSGRADKRYASAREAFEQKRYDDAITALREAYACDPNPVYLANIARAYEESNRPRDALPAWQAYGAAVTDERERRLTEGRVSALRKVVDDLDRLERKMLEAESEKRRAQEEAARLAAAKPAEAPSRPVPAAPLIVVGAGVAGIAVGSVLGGLALSKHATAQAEVDVATAWSEQRSAVDLSRGSTIALVAGGVIAGVGAAWLTIQLVRPARSHASESVAVRASAQGVGLFGKFR